MKSALSLLITICFFEAGLACDHTVRIAVLQDLSKSIHETRTPKATPSHVEPLIRLAKRCGGELAVGIIASQDFEQEHGLLDKPMARLRIPESPTPPDTSGVNAIKALQLRRAYQQAKTEWEKKAGDAVARFKKQLTPFLETPAEANKTDMVGALQRANLFLSEPAFGYSKPIKTYVLAVTDGEQSGVKASSKPRLASGAVLVVVNGTGTTGVLKALDPVVFESLEASIDYVIADTTRRN